MSEVGASVSRMLEKYRDLIRRFVIGDISADEFETDYLARFKDDADQVIGEEFHP
jgi:self-protective colicin-like immunity protein